MAEPSARKRGSDRATIFLSANAQIIVPIGDQLGGGVRRSLIISMAPSMKRQSVGREVCVCLISEMLVAMCADSANRRSTPRPAK